MRPPTQSITRREALGVAAGAAGATLLGGLLRPSPAAAVVYPRTSWLPAGTLVQRPVSTSAREQVLWTTLMRVDDKLAAPLDRFYLWHSTHDAPILRLYTAPSITGPYTERPLCQLPAAPSGWDQNHFQAPDIAWDPVGSRFVASPHSKDPAGQRAQQNSFLIVSDDGISWRYLDTAQRPIVPIGAAAEFDGYAVDYGRFLRDYGGRLVRRAGKYVWYYRGTQRVTEADPSNPGKTHVVERYLLGAATSPDLLTWTKLPGAVADPGQRQLFGAGSALDVGGVTNLVWTVMTSGAATGQMYLKAATGPDPAAFDDGPGTPMYQDASIFDDGGAYVVDGSTHYMSFAALGGANDHWEVRLVRSPVPTDPLGL